MPQLIRPQDVYRSEFMGSVFRDAQMEMFLSCIAITQHRMNPEAWSPFTWDEYVAKCDHKPTEREKNILDAMVSGGEVYLDDMGKSKRIPIEAGYLSKDGDRYVIAEPLLDVMRPYVATS